MRHSTAPSRRRVRHDCDCRTLEQLRKVALRNIAAKINSRVSGMLFLHRLNVSGSLWVVAARDDKSCIRHFRSEQAESLDHQFQTFVSTPFAKRQNAMLRISTAGKIGKFRPARK